MIFGQQDNMQDPAAGSGMTTSPASLGQQPADDMAASAQAAAAMNDPFADDGSTNTALDQQGVEDNMTMPPSVSPAPSLSDEAAADASTSPMLDASMPSAASEPDDSELDDLLVLKQKALGDLSPLVDHLDQTPEEKFRTTMMMIQSTDNRALIKDAYAVAQTIHDDKVRAQALLDVVNEINYFTQPRE